MDGLKALTDDIRGQISNGWRVGMEEKGRIAVFEVVSRLGDRLKGDEKWVIYPKDSGREEGPTTVNPRFFVDLDAKQLVYCHSRSNGQRYMIESLIDRYE